MKQLGFSDEHKKNITAKIITRHRNKHDRIIIIVSLSQATLRPFRSCRFATKEGNIQYGYIKRGTHARVFSQTLVHGISKNEIRERKDKEFKKRGVSEERS